jgi:phosphohistidine phosphatase SixA
LKNNNYEIVLIESSPYLRALQTAKEVANILDVKSIKINYMLSEWMKAAFFQTNPIETLLIRNNR